MNTGRDLTRYEPDVMRKIKFFDDNTQMFWTPQTGGGHVPGTLPITIPTCDREMSSAAATPYRATSPMRKNAVQGYPAHHSDPPRTPLGP